MLPKYLISAVYILYLMNIAWPSFCHSFPFNFLFLSLLHSSPLHPSISLLTCHLSLSTELNEGQLRFSGPLKHISIMTAHISWQILYSWGYNWFCVVIEFLIWKPETVLLSIETSWNVKTGDSALKWTQCWSRVWQAADLSSAFGRQIKGEIWREQEECFGKALQQVCVTKD